MKLFSGLVIILMILFSGVSSGKSITEIVYPAGLVPSTSISMDSENNPSVAFCDDGTLKLATREGSSWNIEEIVTGDATSFCSLEYDNNGYPVIAYMCNSDYTIRFITWNGTSWNDTVIEGGGNEMAGPECSICISSQDESLIAYMFYSSSTPLMFAEEDNSGWSRTVIDPEISRGLNISMALGPDDTPHVACFGQSSRDLIYAVRNEGVWDTHTVDSEGEVGFGVDIAVDSRNLPHISYMDRTIGALKYAYFDGEEWQFRTIVTTGDPTGMLATSIQLDSNDLPRILYSDLVGDQVELAIYDGSSWRIESIDSRGHSISMTIDNEDQLHMSYYRHSYNAQDLKYSSYMP